MREQRPGNGFAGSDGPRAMLRREARSLCFRITNEHDQLHDTPSSLGCEYGEREGREQHADAGLQLAIVDGILFFRQEPDLLDIGYPEGIDIRPSGKIRIRIVRHVQDHQLRAVQPLRRSDSVAGVGEEQ